MFPISFQQLSQFTPPPPSQSGDGLPPPQPDGPPKFRADTEGSCPVYRGWYYAWRWGGNIMTVFLNKRKYTSEILFFIFQKLNCTKSCLFTFGVGLFYFCTPPPHLPLCKVSTIEEPVVFTQQSGQFSLQSKSEQPFMPYFPRYTSSEFEVFVRISIARLIYT